MKYTPLFFCSLIFLITHLHCSAMQYEYIDNLDNLDNPLTQSPRRSRKTVAIQNNTSQRITVKYKRPDPGLTEPHTLLQRNVHINPQETESIIVSRLSDASITVRYQHNDTTIPIPQDRTGVIISDSAQA